MAQSSLPLPSPSLSFCSTVSEGGPPTAAHTVWWKVHKSPQMCPVDTHVPGQWLFWMPFFDNWGFLPSEKSPQNLCR